LARGSRGADEHSRPKPKEKHMEIQEMAAQAREAVNARRIYGAPVKRDGVTVIPAATIRGGSGGGGAEGEDKDTSDGAQGGTGGGAGFGLWGRPVGAYVIKDGEVSWRPAIDVTGIIIRAMLLAALAFLVLVLARSR
jgi:uncharacterized spore protein YtfJ